MVVDHVPEVLGPGAQLDRQSGEVNDLCGVLSGDMSADQSVRRAVKDELEESGDVRVQAGTDEVVVAAMADDDPAPAGPGPLLGEADRADLGICIDAPGSAGVIHLDGLSHGILGRDAGFHNGHGRKHEPGEDVARYMLSSM